MSVAHCSTRDSGQPLPLFQPTWDGAGSLQQKGLDQAPPPAGDVSRGEKAGSEAGPAQPPHLTGSGARLGHVLDESDEQLLSPVQRTAHPLPGLEWRWPPSALNTCPAHGGSHPVPLQSLGQ